LISLIRDTVNAKVKRLHRELDREQSRASLQQVRNALTPEPQLAELLQCIAIFFREQLPDVEVENRNFRVGVYADMERQLTPVYAVDLNNPGYNPFRAYESHPERYQLTAGADAATVVKCVQERRTIIVEDCEKAYEMGEFQYFTAAQRNYIRSMMAYYLGEVCRADGTMVPAALAVDTDSRGFFREVNREYLEFWLREFGTRIKLEMLL